MNKTRLVPHSASEDVIVQGVMAQSQSFVQN